MDEFDVVPIRVMRVCSNCGETFTSEVEQGGSLCEDCWRDLEMEDCYEDHPDDYPAFDADQLFL
jgi:hypothetical protein